MTGRTRPSTKLHKQLVMLLFCALIPGSLSADRILLKNGQTLEGRFVGEEGDTVLIQTSEGQRQVLSSEIEEVKLGLAGMRLCYQLRKDQSSVCDDLFRGIRSGSLVFIQAPYFDQEKQLPLASLSRIQIWPERNSNILKEIDLVSATGKVTLHNGVEMAGLIRKQSDTIVVQGKTGSLDVASRSIAQLELELLEADRVRPQSGPRFLKFVPGYARWQDGNRLIGGVQSGLFFTGAGLALFHGIGMRQTAAQASDPTTWLFYNKSHRQAYNAHATGFKIGSSLALGMFAINLTDVLFFRKSKQTVVANTGGTAFQIGTKIQVREKGLDRVSFASFNLRF